MPPMLSSLPCTHTYAQELFNSRARFALEIISLILAGLFMIVESWDFLQWIIGVYKRRRLMRSASKYKPALYPIPGQRDGVGVSVVWIANRHRVCVCVHVRACVLACLRACVCCGWVGGERYMLAVV